VAAVAVETQKVVSQGPQEVVAVVRVALAAVPVVVVPLTLVGVEVGVEMVTTEQAGVQEL
jgi:hypothetical protein